MARVITVAGRKGGTGKTVLSHSLAHGLGLHGIATVMVTTDPDREILPSDSRRYLTQDGRDPARLVELLARVEGDPQFVVVIDGGGNRPAFDAVLAEASDITIVPFTPSAEDIRVLRLDLQRIPDAYALPNRWPTNAMAKKVADGLLAQRLAEFRGRMMNPMPSVNALTTLVDEGLPSSSIGPACKGFALRILERMGLSLFDFRTA